MIPAQAVVHTLEELDALPVGTILIDERHLRVFVKREKWWVATAEGGTLSAWEIADEYLPLTVLRTPSGSQP